MRYEVGPNDAEPQVEALAEQCANLVVDRQGTRDDGQIARRRQLDDATIDQHSIAWPRANGPHCGGQLTAELRDAGRTTGEVERYLRQQGERSGRYPGRGLDGSRDEVLVARLNVRDILRGGGQDLILVATGIVVPARCWRAAGQQFVQLTLELEYLPQINLPAPPRPN